MKVDPFTHQIIRFVSAMHVATYRLFGGIGPLNRNTLILTTRGRKSGRAIDSRYCVTRKTARPTSSLPTAAAMLRRRGT
jgi:hypothetical protein